MLWTDHMFSICCHMFSSGPCSFSESNRSNVPGQVAAVRSAPNEDVAAAEVRASRKWATLEHHEHSSTEAFGNFQRGKDILSFFSFFSSLFTLFALFALFAFSSFPFLRTFLLLFWGSGKQKRKCKRAEHSDCAHLASQQNVPQVDVASTVGNHSWLKRILMKGWLEAKCHGARSVHLALCNTLQSCKATHASKRESRV